MKGRFITASLFQDINDNYSNNFFENHITGNRLLNLTDNELQKMGILPVGDRMDILKAVSSHSVDSFCLIIGKFPLSTHYIAIDNTFLIKFRCELDFGVVFQVSNVDVL